MRLAMHFALLQHRLIAHIRSRVRSGELTERSAARLTGVSQPHLHNVLKGTRLLSPSMADQILTGLNLSLFDLLEAEEFHAWGARLGSPTSVPVLAGRLGPGLPFPVAEASREEFPLLASLLSRAEDPALVRLSRDPRMESLFHEGDTVLLERSPAARREPVGFGFYAVEHAGEGLVRRVRRGGGRLRLLVPEEGDSSAGDYISLADRNILEVVKAKVVWIGRNLEPPSVASTSNR